MICLLDTTTGATHRPAFITDRSSDEERAKRINDIYERLARRGVTREMVVAFDDETGEPIDDKTAYAAHTICGYRVTARSAGRGESTTLDVLLATLDAAQTLAAEVRRANTRQRSAASVRIEPVLRLDRVETIDDVKMTVELIADEPELPLDDAVERSLWLSVDGGTPPPAEPSVSVKIVPQGRMAPTAWVTVRGRSEEACRAALDAAVARARAEIAERFVLERVETVSLRWRDRHEPADTQPARTAALPDLTAGESAEGRL